MSKKEKKKRKNTKIIDIKMSAEDQQLYRE